MGRTSIQVSEELADELYERKQRGESYEDVVWRLIEQAEGEQDTLSRERAQQTRDAAPDPDVSDEAGVADVEPESGVQVPREGEIADAVWDAVDEVAQNWDHDDRFSTRRLAAASVLQYALDSGEHIGKSSEIVEAARERHPVEGQGDDTWWKKNVREVLQSVGDYSKGKHGYRVDSLNGEKNPD